MKIHIEQIKNQILNLDWQLILVWSVIIGLIFWIAGLKTELKCYKVLSKDQCNLIYSEK